MSSIAGASICKSMEQTESAVSAREVGKRRPRDAALIYAENRLTPWATWARKNRERLGLPTVSLLFQAMRMTKVGIIRSKVSPWIDDKGILHYPISAERDEARSMRSVGVEEVPTAIVEVDTVVAHLPEHLRIVIMADYFASGPIVVRCKETPFARARYSQLLESAKYSIFQALKAYSLTPLRGSEILEAN